MGAHVSPHPEPPPVSLPTPSLWVVPEHRLECPASCIKLALVICFTHGNIHVAMLFSNHPTLTFSHRVQKSVLNICVSLAVLHIGSSLWSF